MATQMPTLFPTQPAVKLATANMGLLLRFSSSPEVMSQATQAAGQMLQQAATTTMKMWQSDAFAQLAQGLLKNYTDFLAESGRGVFGAMSEGQATLARGMQDAARTAVEAASSRGPRTGKAS